MSHVHSLTDMHYKYLHVGDATYHVLWMTMVSRLGAPVMRSECSFARWSKQMKQMWTERSLIRPSLAPTRACSIKSCAAKPDSHSPALLQQRAWSQDRDALSPARSSRLLRWGCLFPNVSEHSKGPPSAPAHPPEAHPALANGRRGMQSSGRQLTEPHRSCPTCLLLCAYVMATRSTLLGAARRSPS